jgi:hypothetical protein
MTSSWRLPHLTASRRSAVDLRYTQTSKPKTIDQNGRSRLVPCFEHNVSFHRRSILSMQVLSFNRHPPHLLPAQQAENPRNSALREISVWLTIATVAEVPRVIRLLTQTPPSLQEETINQFFTSSAEFVHPFCRIWSYNGSRWAVTKIYQWYKIMSPHIDLDVRSVGMWCSHNLEVYSPGRIQC